MNEGMIRPVEDNPDHEKLTLRALKKNNVADQVVVSRDGQEAANRIAGYERGCDGYMRKPVDFDKFVEVVRRLGAYWLVLNEPPPSPAPGA